MNKYEITKRIEKFAPPELAEKWDCSGWIVETSNTDIQKIMLCLTVTDDVVKQAKNQNCDMIISHHPLFKINCHSELISESLKPLIDIYCAHTNMDRTNGGTTDTLIETIFHHSIKEQLPVQSEVTSVNGGFIRYVNYPISINDFIEKLKTISPHLRYVNNKGITKLKRIAFCAGSGTEFIQEAFENGADALVTGDLKFHTALDSPIVVFDIGHFESEIMVLDVFEKLINNYVKVVRAKEHSPLIYPF